MTGLFASYSPLCSLTVGGKTIRTTAEHPFWVKGRGWRHAHQIESGDELRAEDGRWLAVEAVTGNEGAEPVYNVVVEEYHTYFVGEGTWGFAVWAHNAKYDANADRSGKPFTPRGKKEVIAANKRLNDGKMVCEGCGTDMIPHPKSQKGVTPNPREVPVDHKIPQSLGGQGIPSNGAALCRKCNRQKSNNYIGG